MGGRWQRRRTCRHCGDRFEANYPARLCELCGKGVLAVAAGQYKPPERKRTRRRRKPRQRRPRAATSATELAEMMEISWVEAVALMVERRREQIEAR